MPDSDAIGQDDATARLNGLQSLLGKRQTRIEELEAQLVAQEPAQPVDSQPYEDGLSYRFDAATGQMVEQAPPTPRGNNGQREPREPKRVTEEDLRQSIRDATGGGNAPRNDW